MPVARAVGEAEDVAVEAVGVGVQRGDGVRVWAGERVSDARSVRVRDREAVTERAGEEVRDGPGEREGETLPRPLRVAVSRAVGDTEHAEVPVGVRDCVREAVKGGA